MVSSGEQGEEQEEQEEEGLAGQGLGGAGRGRDRPGYHLYPGESLQQGGRVLVQRKIYSEGEQEQEQEREQDHFTIYNTVNDALYSSCDFLFNYF